MTDPSYVPPNRVTLPNPFKAGRYTVLTSTTIATAVMGAGSGKFGGFFVPFTATLDRLALEVTTAGDAGSVIRLGIYADDGGGQPGKLVADFGTVPGDVVGVSEAVSTPVVLAPGTYWYVTVTANAPVTAPTVRVMASTPAVAPTLPGGQTTGVTGLTFPIAAPGPLPADLTGSAYAIAGASAVPRLFAKAV